MARPPTTRRSPVEASAVTPSPACTVALRTSSARADRVRAARRIAAANGCVEPVSAPAASDRTRATSSSPVLPSRPPAPMGSTATISGSPSRTVPRALSTAMFADPARSKARGSLYVMPLARAARCARAKCSATSDTRPFAPNAIAAADIAASTCTGVAFVANVATPTSSAATGTPRSTVWRRTRAVGAATSMRAAGTDRSLTQARSRPDHVVVMRRRLETTRAPATSGSPSRLATSTVAPSHGRTRASPAVTIASTPTISPASTTMGSPGRMSAAGSSIVSSPWMARTRTSRARSTASRATCTRSRERPTVVSIAIATAHASPANTAMATARGSDTACAHHAAATAPRPARERRDGCGSDGSRRERWTRSASAAHAKTTSGTRATSATAPSRPIAGASTPATMPRPSMTAVAPSERRSGTAACAGALRAVPSRPRPRLAGRRERRMRVCRGGPIDAADRPMAVGPSVRPGGPNRARRGATSEFTGHRGLPLGWGHTSATVELLDRRHGRSRRKRRRRRVDGRSKTGGLRSRRWRVRTRTRPPAAARSARPPLEAARFARRYSCLHDARQK